MAKTYTTVVDKSAGDVFTEFMWDTYIRDNVNNLIVRPFCLLRRTTTQSISNGTETVVLFDTETQDNDSMHSTSVDTGRITPTTAGVYLLTATFSYFASAGGTSRLIGIGKNGGGITEARGGAVGTMSGSAAVSCTVSILAEANGSSDYFELRTYHDAGAALSIYADAAGTPCRFQAAWLGKIS